VSYLASARISEEEAAEGYPFDLAAVRALSDIDFAQVTVLVGDNGAGKSTLVEALAIAAGFNPEGGSRNLRFETHATHSQLADALVLTFRNTPKWGWFLRAETFYGMASHLEEDDDPFSGVKAMFPDLHARSHGESFLTLIEERMTTAGLYFLDEPESALSFHGQLKLMRSMFEACAVGAQFVIATHSPLLMAYPGAAIHQLSSEGSEQVPFNDVEAVTLWRNFLEAPERFFRHLFDEMP